ncbi:hypothetical protein ACH5RR_018728 [Cinchona calisaya]|uniref:Uncharacterized protein n=1 Tax=Cinchona calisaya TaxID=153742 RepID=A0ABD2ZN68_9GENT
MTKPSSLAAGPAHFTAAKILTVPSSKTRVPIHQKSNPPHFLNLIKPSSSKPLRRFFTVYSSISPAVDSDVETTPSQPQNGAVSEESHTVEEIRSPSVIPSNLGLGLPKLSLSDQAFFLLLFIASTTTASLVGFLAAAIPTLSAMGRTAIALSKLADTAHEEVPSTMAAIRLSCLEISDLTVELSDLSQEVADGVSKSTQAVQAADAGIRQIGSLAREQTKSMIEERANLPVISLQPFVAGAAKKTSHVVGRATRTFVNIISRRELNSEKKDDSTLDSLEV